MTARGHGPKSTNLNTMYCKAVMEKRRRDDVKSVSYAIIFSINYRVKNISPPVLFVHMSFVDLKVVCLCLSKCLG